MEVSIQSSQKTIKIFNAIGQLEIAYVNNTGQLHHKFKKRGVYIIVTSEEQLKIKV